MQGFPAGDPVLDLLQRRGPRLAGAAPLESPADPTVAAVVRDVLRLDRSFLAVQGPPGSGKTHVGAHVIAALVRDHGWKVGVVAQSHPVIENLLFAGSNTQPGVGVPMVLLSGRLAAERITGPTGRHGGIAA